MTTLSRLVKKKQQSQVEEGFVLGTVVSLPLATCIAVSGYERKLWWLGTGHSVAEFDV
jgi:hypothetical protein